MFNNKPCKKCKPLFDKIDRATAKLLNTLMLCFIGMFILTLWVGYIKWGMS